MFSHAGVPEQFFLPRELDAAILGFLDLRELSLVVCVCQAWSEAVNHEKKRRALKALQNIAGQSEFWRYLPNLVFNVAVKDQVRFYDYLAQGLVLDEEAKALLDSVPADQLIRDQLVTCIGSEVVAALAQDVSSLWDDFYLGWDKANGLYPRSKEDFFKACEQGMRENSEASTLDVKINVLDRYVGIEYRLLEMLVERMFQSNDAYPFLKLSENSVFCAIDILSLPVVRPYLQEVFLFLFLQKKFDIHDFILMHYFDLVKTNSNPEQLKKVEYILETMRPMRTKLEKNWRIDSLGLYRLENAYRDYVQSDKVEGVPEVVILMAELHDKQINSPYFPPLMTEIMSHYEFFKKLTVDQQERVARLVLTSIDVYNFLSLLRDISTHAESEYKKYFYMWLDFRLREGSESKKSLAKTMIKWRHNKDANIPGLRDEMPDICHLLFSMPKIADDKLNGILEKLKNENLSLLSVIRLLCDCDYQDLQGYHQSMAVWLLRDYTRLSLALSSARLNHDEIKLFIIGIAASNAAATQALLSNEELLWNLRLNDADFLMLAEQADRACAGRLLKSSSEKTIGFACRQTLRAMAEEAGVYEEQRSFGKAKRHADLNNPPIKYSHSMPVDFGLFVTGLMFLTMMAMFVICLALGLGFVSIASFGCLAVIMLAGVMAFDLWSRVRGNAKEKQDVDLSSSYLKQISELFDFDREKQDAAPVVSSLASPATLPKAEPDTAIILDVESDFLLPRAGR